ncbi:hypothetical protein ROTO_36800 [Roseovarius tolerans]|uniref:Uncharacterized protein n=1 Tax=Roseovarius tolerans TaxID=74031 RepID=A0A0L6CPT4_9RHOB|nr:hypothetical protein ROTO_36800 [Roseovarius tolerans]
MARGNREQRLPHLDLKRRADHVEHGFAASLKPCIHPMRDLLRGLYIDRVGPPRAHIGHGHITSKLCGKGHTAQTTVGPHGKRLTEGAVEPAVIDDQSRPLARELTGAHRLPSQKQIMQPPRARQPRRIGGLQSGIALRQKGLGMTKRQILLVTLGRYAHPLREKPLKMRGAHAHLTRKVLERKCLVARIDQVNRTAHDVVVVGIVGCMILHCDLCGM